MNEWFKVNKLSLSTKKSVFSLYHKHTQKDNLPMALQILRINGVELKRKATIKLLRVLLDEKLTWKALISTTENKIIKTL